MRQPTDDAYLTVFLALMFGVVLSLLLVLIEGAAIGATRLQSEIVVDLALDSVFAEYNRELLDQYELFFIDSSYGTTNGGVGMVEERLKDYMSYNLTPKKNLEYVGFTHSWLALDNPYLEIDKISYATDDNGLVWKSTAVNYMKAVYGGDVISSVVDMVNTAEAKGFSSMDVSEQLRKEKESIDKAINGSENEIEEYNGADAGDYTYDKVSSAFDNIVGGGLLRLAAPSQDFSKAVVEGGPFYSVRSKSGSINKGNGVHEGMKKASGIQDEFFYNRYLMTMMGTYTQPKDKGMLKYQIEYILFGCNNDADNMEKCVEALFALRSASNYTSILNDSAKKNVVNGVVTVVCTLLGHPELAEPITNLILGMWAVAEAYCDVKILLNGGSVPLIKSSGDWNVSIEGIFSGSIFNASKNNKGIDYNRHLEIMLGIANKNTKLARSLDIVEMDLRLTKGNEGFRIDRCVDYINVKFGFSDGYGHEYLYDRSKCYE